MRREDLNIPPGETDEIRLELGGSIADRGAPLVFGKEGEIEDTLPHLRLASMNKVSQIGDPDGVDLFAGQENIENRFHQCCVLCAEC